MAFHPEGGPKQPDTIQTLKTYFRQLQQGQVALDAAYLRSRYIILSNERSLMTDAALAAKVDVLLPKLDTLIKLGEAGSADPISAMKKAAHIKICAEMLAGL